MKNFEKEMNGLRASMTGLIKGMEILKNAKVEDPEIQRKINEALTEGSKVSPLIGLIENKIESSFKNIDLSKSIDEIINLLEKSMESENATDAEKEEIKKMVNEKINMSDEQREKINTFTKCQ